MHKVKEPDFEDETSNQEGVNSTNLGDERKPVPLLPKTTGLSTVGEQCELYSETVAGESIDSACGKTKTSETSEIAEKEQA